ncbi:hypothetical protein FZC79_15090 [Rossellomorea vietnamensis]|uniref:Uncharacterized protein n=1 Tax=Rossellomorea vietnamensis TaxID=218284 RepID=A0A5D4KCL0_9BACI|nr:hypothetical protein [Rossellomorea vietnamensis]TYR74405.1 hypothetical protein FZC79_15090 [Rossellomorea vietnamensis]
MLVYFSMKSAAALLALCIVAGIFMGRSNYKGFYILDFVSLGAGRAISGVPLIGLIMYLSGSLMAFVSKVIIESSEFGHFEPVISLLTYFIFTIVILIKTPEVSAEAPTGEGDSTFDDDRLTMEDDIEAYIKQKHERQYQDYLKRRKEIGSKSLTDILAESQSASTNILIPNDSDEDQWEQEDQGEEDYQDELDRIVEEREGEIETRREEMDEKDTMEEAVAWDDLEDEMDRIRQEMEEEERQEHYY